jgi:TM2 domain-containing membrane protein YozV
MRPPAPSSAPPAPPVAPIITVTESKNPGNAALLAILLGLVGFLGVGHVYVGRIGRGVLILAIGLILRFLFVISLFPFLWKGGGALIMGILGIGNLGLFVWQIYDAYKLAKQFNAHVQQHGKAPW